MKRETGLDIAVIGSGVAGLTAAWQLGKNHNLTLFEKSQYWGMGQKSYTMPNGEASITFDIPPRVINREHYKQLFDLLDEVGIETYVIKQEVSYSDLTMDTYLSFRTINNPFLSLSLPKTAITSLPFLIKHGAELVRFYYQLWLGQESTDIKKQSLKQYLRSQGFSKDFCHSFLYPLWSLMCTCDYRNVERFPAAHMLRLLKSFTSTSKSRRISGGTQALECKLRENIQHMELGQQVLGIDQSKNKIAIFTKKGASYFDHVVIATEPNIAAKLLPPRFAQERILLEAIPTIETKMILHTDLNLMPKKRENWAPVNLFWSKEQAQSSATLWMNKIDEASNHLNGNIFQTWNPITPIAEDKILSEQSFRRTLMTKSSLRSITKLRRHMQHDRGRQIWFAGSYCSPGVPLLESGVQSALFVDKALRAKADHGGQKLKRTSKRGNGIYGKQNRQVSR